MTQIYKTAFDGSKLKANGTISVLVGFEFNASEAQAEDHDDPADPILTVEAEFCLTYSIESLDNIDTTCFDHFARVNGPYNSWPYWRELVQSATCRVGLTPITIPVFRPPEIQIPDDQIKC